ncbi:MAG: PaaI family thioesterase [Haloarculaceae archaeon]
MDVERIFERMPFARHLGIEITDIGDGAASGRIGLGEEHSSTPTARVAHGGVTYALADTVGGAAVIGAVESVAPTLDMRIDYLAPATGEVIRADAEVVRLGSVATVDVDVTDGEGSPVAAARGVYKTGGGEGKSAWTGGAEPDAAVEDL